MGGVRQTPLAVWVGLVQPGEGLSAAKERREREEVRLFLPASGWDVAGDGRWPGSSLLAGRHRVTGSGDSVQGPGGRGALLAEECARGSEHKH